MDIVTHAVVGAVTGQAFGYPITGAIIGILPDFPIAISVIRRYETPPWSYDFTHSLLYLLLMSGALWLLTGMFLFPALCLASHLFLDLCTHSDEWSPPLLFPVPRTVVNFSVYHKEWEFFNKSWWIGLAHAVIWCLVVSSMGVQR